MRKLQNITYAHSSKMTQEAKDELLISNDFHGSVAIESWWVNGRLERKGVCVMSVRDYLLSLGEFKDVPIKREYIIYICRKCGTQLSEEIMGKKCPDCGEWTYHKDCQKNCVLAKECESQGGKKNGK